MKFANLDVNSDVVNNIGENMQIMAIDNLYKYMGIDKKDIVRIDYMKMDEYNGEEVILPINWYFHKFFKYGKKNIFSDKIIPVFLGVSFMSNVFSDEEVLFLKKCEPIGCRDEWTYKNLKAYGINAYFNGCMTSLFPKREECAEDQKKVFFVDIPQELLEYIPDHLAANAEFVTHVFEEKIEDIQQFTCDVYERYKREAKLVITSRLHCASPCLAAGIPVILAISQCIYTLGWIEKYIPVYTKSQFGGINWDPRRIEYEEMKGFLLENARERVLQMKYSQTDLEQISDYFSNRPKVKEYIIPTVTPVMQFIRENWDVEDSFEYGFWGITGITDMIYKFISENYPKAKLEKVYDKGYVNNKQNYHDIASSLPECITNDNVFIFITAYSATEEAKDLFQKIGRDSRTYCLCCDMKKSF